MSSNINLGGRVKKFYTQAYPHFLTLLGPVLQDFIFLYTTKYAFHREGNKMSPLIPKLRTVLFVLFEFFANLQIKVTFDLTFHIYTYKIIQCEPILIHLVASKCFIGLISGDFQGNAE